jgi:ParB-like chromosome segregation protein Spo0J
MPPVSPTPDIADVPDKAEKKAVEQDKAGPEAPGDEAPTPAKGRGRQSRADRPEQEPKPDKPGKQKQAENIGGASAPNKEEAQNGHSLAEQKRKLEQELREKYGIPKSSKPVEKWVAPEEEKVVRIPHEKIRPFKDHPFNVEKNAKYLAFVSSIRAHGVTQPAVVRPSGKGDFYEMISGHRRDEGSKDAGIPYTPVIIRALNDE